MTFIESIAMLPKNLALISHDTGKDMCVRHHKKYEAYCEKENMLICIECILQDGHKNHEMDSIHNVTIVVASVMKSTRGCGIRRCRRY